MAARKKFPEHERTELDIGQQCPCCKKPLSAVWHGPTLELTHIIFKKGDYLLHVAEIRRIGRENIPARLLVAADKKIPDPTKTNPYDDEEPKQ